jgi:hypothetical protein
VTKLEDLENEIKRLSPEELRELRRWFAEFDAELWDQEIERDAAAGKLDLLADEALDEHERGQCRAL